MPPIPRLLLTPGEPAGIGPDIALQWTAQRQESPVEEALELAVVADPELLRSRANELGLPIGLAEIDPGKAPRPTPPGILGIIPVPLRVPARRGQLDPGNAEYVLDTLRLATQLCLDRRADALVTGPIHKGVINDAGIPFSGHTEFLAAQTAAPQVVMMLATPGLRVALATTHLPLRAVSDAITMDKLESVLRVLHRDLRTRFGIETPRVLVCGLNPHAGEGGHMGDEEIRVIGPVLDALRGEGMSLFGPLPADTLFTPRYLDQADAVLAMYHDQGLPVLKYKGFGKAVNITLGLPIVRTSVDHGTALDLAGSGRADPGSLGVAIHTAASMVAAGQRTLPPTPPAAA